jgi:hypothetical protein
VESHPILDDARTGNSGRGLSIFLNLVSDLLVKSMGLFIT